MEIFMQLVAYIMIYAACDIGRGPESQLELISKQKALQIVMVVTGVMIYSAYSH